MSRAILWQFNRIYSVYSTGPTSKDLFCIIDTLMLQKIWNQWSIDHCLSFIIIREHFCLSNPFNLSPFAPVPSCPGFAKDSHCDEAGVAPLIKPIKNFYRAFLCWPKLWPFKFESDQSKWRQMSWVWQIWLTMSNFPRSESLNTFFFSGSHIRQKMLQSPLTTGTQLSPFIISSRGHSLINTCWTSKEWTLNWLGNSTERNSNVIVTKLSNIFYARCLTAECKSWSDFCNRILKVPWYKFSLLVFFLSFISWSTTHCGEVTQVWSNMPVNANIWNHIIAFTSQSRAIIEAKFYI